MVYLALKPCLKLFNKDMNFWGTSQVRVQGLQVDEYRETATAWPHSAGQGELWAVSSTQCDYQGLPQWENIWKELQQGCYLLWRESIPVGNAENPKKTVCGQCGHLSHGAADKLPGHLEPWS